MTGTITPFDAMFSGLIGKDNQMLKLISPYAVEMSRLVGEAVGQFCQQSEQIVNIVELGGGTGITTLSILSSAANLKLLSVDNEPIMQNQAKHHLQNWVIADKLRFSADDALSALRALPTASVDILASAYTLHNFQADYRLAVIFEIYRVLKPAGQLINGDRYALDDVSAHTRCTQQEVAGYFKVLTSFNRLDLLEQWIIHLFNDESENHIMREALAVQQLVEAGFQQINVSQRHDVNALLKAVK
ncbi:class I SAM-dependent methyltransferase [Methylomonas sp. AM2-LC]|uniref:class I SAM-dependent methyltransferase n=1 Tax=Methylomonas sp. AM2-LC TaxID=3153301 RepID=UPI0032630C2D